MINYIKGNLITMALEGKSDVIAHGCNCFCLQGAGIAKQMNNTFETQSIDFPMELPNRKGDISKLGNIDWATYFPEQDTMIKFNQDVTLNRLDYKNINENFVVVNAYTQFEPGPNADLTAIRMCFKKMNHIFKGKHIGLPQIGCGIGGLVWEDVEKIIYEEFTNCEITVVIYKP